MQKKIVFITFNSYFMEVEVNNTINQMLDFLVSHTLFAYSSENMPYQKVSNISNETLHHGVEIRCFK